MSRPTEWRRLPLPYPRTDAERIRILLAAEFTPAEINALGEKRREEVARNVVTDLAVFVLNPTTVGGTYDLVVPHDDPVKALRELTPAKRAEIKHDAALTLADLAREAEVGSTLEQLKNDAERYETWATEVLARLDAKRAAEAKTEGNDGPAH